MKAAQKKRHADVGSGNRAHIFSDLAPHLRVPSKTHPEWSKRLENGRHISFFEIVHNGANVDSGQEGGRGGGRGRLVRGRGT